MNKAAILVAVPLLFLLPGDSHPRGPVRGGGARPAVARPGPVHTPSFSNVGRPNLPGPAGGVHPGFVPQQRPNVNIANRPNVVTQPNIANRTNTGIANRANIGNQPIINSGNRTNIVANRPANIVNRPINVNQTNTINRTQVNNINRQNLYAGGRAAWGGRPYYNYYRNYNSGWVRGHWNRWNWNPWAWGAGAAALGWQGTGGNTYVYSNPFYVVPPPTVIQVPAVDYSQPIAAPPAPPAPSSPSVIYPIAAAAAAEQPSEPAPEPEVPPEVTRLVDAARAAFRAGDYARALTQIDQAIDKLPDDAALHEFRALIQFALKDYAAAAATIYAVLDAGPGWDWATVQGMYPDAATYTAQLRALETYQKANPDAADASFLLAYHYLVLNHPEAAAKQLDNVIRLLPKDSLAPRLLQAIRPSQDRPGPQP